ncbi:MAG: 8-amino-7-oxononanoate synthase [Aestuariibacter sp.]
MAFEFLAERLQERRQQGLLRAPVEVQTYQQQYILVAGRSYINFSSNDYLGLAQHPQLLAKASNNGADVIAGSGGSPLVTGHSSSHQALIDYICEQTQREAGLLCNSGFAANFSILQSLLLSKKDIALMDKLSHASMIDGALASEGRIQRFRHNDVAHLTAKLEAQTADNCLVVTEGVFSMDGDKAPLTSIAPVCASHNAWLMVDDAHAIGVTGKQGFGHADSDGLSQAELPVWMATFGKGVGTSGAIICGSKTLIQYLNNFARHYIYSTAMSPLQAQLTLHSLQLMTQETWRREKLQGLIAQFQEGASRFGFNVLPSSTAIQPVIIGEPNEALLASEKLQQKGIWVSAIRSPTVPVGSDRLRVTLTANHDAKDVDYLLRCLQEVLQA